MPTQFSKATLLWVAIALLLAFVPTATAQITVKNEDVTFKFGIQGQLWGEWTQDSTGSQAYQQNFYLRRLRIIVGGDIGKDISFFVETDDPKLGIQPKNLAAGLLWQEALLEWRPTTVFQLVGGEMIVPFSPNGLQSTLSYLTLNISPISSVSNAATQNTACA